MKERKRNILDIVIIDNSPSKCLAKFYTIQIFYHYCIDIVATLSVSISMTSKSPESNTKLRHYLLLHQTIMLWLTRHHYHIFIIAGPLPKFPPLCFMCSTTMYEQNFGKNTYHTWNNTNLLKDWLVSTSTFFKRKSWLLSVQYAQYVRLMLLGSVKLSVTSFQVNLSSIFSKLPFKLNLFTSSSQSILQMMTRMINGG